MRGGLAATWAQQLKHLRTAHRLRPGPHTGIALAGQLAMKPKGKAEARQLVEEALRLYPDHPHVLSNAGDVLIQVSSPAAVVQWMTDFRFINEECISLFFWHHPHEGSTVT